MPDSENAEVVEVDNATDMRTQLDVFGYNADLDFRKLALEAQYHAEGFRLVEKNDLIGVPHVIIGMTYREGFPRNGAVGDYVSIEAVVADKDTLDTPPVKSMMAGTDVTVFGNEPVVYNDSGTGIRRVLTELLQDAGLIDVGKPRGDENPFDKPYQFWAKGEEIATQGIKAVANRPFRYLALRGLRRSDYESPYGPATTFYLG